MRHFASIVSAERSAPQSHAIKYPPLVTVLKFSFGSTLTLFIDPALGLLEALQNIFQPVQGSLVFVSGHFANVEDFPLYGRQFIGLLFV